MGRPFVRGSRRGTVVTGTLTGGRLHVGDELVVVRGRGEHAVHVRGLQSLGQSHDGIGPGNRTAVNVVGVHHDEVSRGDALVRSGQWHRTRTFDASLHVLASLDHDVSRRGAFVAYIGSGEHAVRLRILGPGTLAPGENGLARLHISTALPLTPGDRYVLRENGRSETVGGGEILDVDPIVPAARARPDRSVDRVVAERGWVTVEELERLTGQRRDPTVGQWVVDADALTAARESIIGRIEAAGALGLDVATLDDHARAVLDELAQDGTVAVAGGRAVQAGAGIPSPVTRSWPPSKQHPSVPRRRTSSASIRSSCASSCAVGWSSSKTGCGSRRRPSTTRRGLLRRCSR